MTLARKNQICLEATPYYHLINRCVRRGFLCGYDKLTKKDFSHRKQLLLERLKYLADTFAIKICAYAILDNHYHLVVCVDAEAASHWSRDEVLERYARIHSTQRILDLLDDEDDPSDDPQREIYETIEEWRSRLMSLSWFEKSLNEYIARAANREDKVTGRFWQGRFKSQPLLDDAALITCMVYVDLNPVRAGIADLPETSDFTSIQQRLRDYLENQKKKQIDLATRTLSAADLERKSKPLKYESQKAKRKNAVSKDTLRVAPAMLPLAGFLDDVAPDKVFRIPILAMHYFDLLDATGRAVADGKRGHIPDHLPALVSKLGLNPKEWLGSVTHYKTKFPSVLGAQEVIKDFVGKLENRHWCVGMKACAGLYRRT